MRNILISRFQSIKQHMMKYQDFVLLLFLFNFNFVSSKKRYDYFKIISIYPETDAQLAKILFLVNSKSEAQILHEGSNQTKTIDVCIPPTLKPDLLGLLKRNRIKFHIKTSNLQKDIDKEQQSNQRSASQFLFRSNSETRLDNFAFDKYNRYDEIVNLLDQLEGLYPNTTKIHNIGKSVQNRILKINTNMNDATKPSIWIDAGIHAREWIAPSTVLYFINKLLTSRDLNIKATVNNFNWFILPLMNPDGYEYSHTTDRLWRKNRMNGSYCDGIDLNRNWDFNFGGVGTSANECSYNYKGKNAFSEPETKAVKDFLLSLKPNLLAYVTVHSYSQVIGFGWGYKSQLCSPDVDDSVKVVEKAKEALEAVHGTRYTTGTIANTMYPVGGASDDWVKVATGVKYSLLFELRPCSFCGNGFILPSTQIIPTGQETTAGLIAAADEMQLNLKPDGYFNNNAKCYVTYEHFQHSPNNITTSATTSAYTTPRISPPTTITSVMPLFITATTTFSTSSAISDTIVSSEPTTRTSASTSTTVETPTSSTTKTTISSTIRSSSTQTSTPDSTVTSTPSSTETSTPILTSKQSTAAGILQLLTSTTSTILQASTTHSTTVKSTSSTSLRITTNLQMDCKDSTSWFCAMVQIIPSYCKDKTFIQSCMKTCNGC